MKLGEHVYRAQQEEDAEGASAEASDEENSSDEEVIMDADFEDITDDDSDEKSKSA